MRFGVRVPGGGQNISYTDIIDLWLLNTEICRIKLKENTEIGSNPMGYVLFGSVAQRQSGALLRQWSVISKFPTPAKN